jgi:hypothetical protein
MRAAARGLTTGERADPVRLRRENRVLKMERDLLSRAADGRRPGPAFFATENVKPR